MKINDLSIDYGIVLVYHTYINKNVIILLNRKGDLSYESKYCIYARTKRFKN